MPKIKDENLIKRISERTGLKKDWEINAYVNFIESADLDDGLIMFGGCQHSFWEEAQEWIIKKKYGEETYKMYNGPNFSSIEREEIEEFVNPLASEISEKEYNYYSKIFAEKGLITEPRFCRGNNETKYPVLISYNFYNDPELYVSYKGKDSDGGWSGRISKGSLTEELRKDWESKGIEFKF